jgi:hypothetical protein
MAIVRCPRCNLPLTETEALAPVCPVCANPMADEPASSPIVAAGPETQAPVGRSHRFERLLLAAAAIVIALLTFSLAAVPRPLSDREEIALLRERAQAAEQQLRAAQDQAKQARADNLAAQTKLAAAEKMAADALAELQVLEQQVALEKKEHLAQIAMLKELKESLPPKDAGKRVDAKVRIIADGVLRVIRIDKADGEFRLPGLNNGAHVKLTGRVKTLRLDPISGGMLDASELTAGDIVFTGGINNSAKVKVTAQSSVTVPFIDTRSEVEIASREGKVTVGWINGSARVEVIAREFTLRDYLDGKDTTVTATVTAASRFQFREIRGKSRFLWKKALATDPEIEYKQGIIRAPAEFRQLPNG